MKIVEPCNKTSSLPLQDTVERSGEKVLALIHWILRPPTRSYPALQEILITVSGEILPELLCDGICPFSMYGTLQSLSERILEV